MRVGEEFDTEASQTRDELAMSQTTLPHDRAACPDPSLRKGGLLRMATCASANCTARKIKIK